jgi:hypothetical protein
MGPVRPPLPNQAHLSTPKRTDDVLPKPDNLISYRQLGPMYHVGNTVLVPLKRLPADLNRRDSQGVRNERVFGH